MVARTAVVAIPATERAEPETATLAIDDTVIPLRQVSDQTHLRRHRAVSRGWRGQPNTDVIVAEEFRGGNSLLSGLTRWVSAGSGYRRVVEKALAALRGGASAGLSARRPHAVRTRVDALAG